MTKKPIVVLLSGSGSNLQALLDVTAAPDFPAEVVAVISNRPGALGLTRAQNHGVPAITLDHKEFVDRASFDRALQKTIDQFSPELVVLAGFMRILTPDLVNHYQGRMLNIHPSLLPKYPGLHTHRRAIDAGDLVHGATVHFVTTELDGGPAIIHAEVAVEPGDTEATLARRVLSKEHLIYPLAVRLFSENRLALNEGEVWLDGQRVGRGGIRYDT